MQIAEGVFTRGGDPRRVGGDMDEWLTGMLERNQRGRGEEIKARPYLYGSDAGFCARRNVLLAHNTWMEATVNSAGRGYMAIGVAFEELLINALQKEEVLLSSQFRISGFPGLKISGKIDAIVFDWEGDLALLEVKTCGDFPKSAAEKPAHLAQIQMYSAITGIRKAYLVYMSRKLNPLQPVPIRVFRVDTGDEALLERLQIARLSDLLIREEKLPPVPVTFRKHTECHWCEFRDPFCWGERKGRGGDPETPPLPELTVTEYIQFSELASQLAISNLDGIEWMELETVRDLIKLEDLSKDNRNKLLELKNRLITKLAGI